jgi:hypothetical protein
MANVYEVDPALRLYVDAIIENGHAGFVEVTDPPSLSSRERVTRDLGPASDMQKKSLVVVARVVVQNAKDAILTVDVYQKDAAGAPANKQTFRADLPSSGPRKRKNLSVDVAIR